MVTETSREPMITVTVTQLPFTMSWRVVVENNEQGSFGRREYRSFVDSFDACLWGLRTAERMRGRQR